MMLLDILGFAAGRARLLPVNAIRVVVVTFYLMVY